MKMFPILRILSLLAYVCIFLHGEKIAIPVGIYLLFGLFETDPSDKFFILGVLADLALLSLFTLTLVEKTRKTILVEVAAYVFLLLPLMVAVTSTPIRQFEYPLFTIPAVGFAVLYPISVVLSYSNYRKKQTRLAAHNMNCDKNQI